MLMQCDEVYPFTSEWVWSAVRGELPRATLPAGLVLFFWFIAQLFNGVAALGPAVAAMGGVAYFAHIGGFAFGWVIGQGYKRGEA